MPSKEDQGYRNPAYIYDEGPAGGGPDTRSASSTSSRSSMKYISTKLKGQGRRRWLFLVLIVVIAIALIVAITTAIYFTRNTHSESTLVQAVVDGDRDIAIKPTNQSFVSTTERTITTTNEHTSDTTSTITATITALTTTTTKTSSEATSKSSNATSKMTTSFPSVNTTSTSENTTLSISTSQFNRSVESTTESNANNRTIPLTTLSKISNESTTGPTTSPVAGNLSVGMSDILYNPNDVTSITLQCQGRHHGNWRTLTIRRQFKDSYEPVAVAVLNDNDEIEVFKFYPNVSHLVNFGDNFVSLILTFDPFLCTELTNFTCVLADEKYTASTRANITIFMPEPEIDLPHSIVEEKRVTLLCNAEVWGSNANIVWKFKPEYTQVFMEFSVKPVNNVTRKECSTVITSSLEFNPTMYEDGAEFRCEVKDFDYHPQVLQQNTNEVTLKVVPSNYCEGKRQFTINPHPHGPCTLVVYCLDTGPLVYEIECEKGHCYDYTKTACVPPENA